MALAWGLAAGLPAQAADAGTAAAGPTTAPTWARALASWWQQVGPRRPGEGYGALVARVGACQLGRPYQHPLPALDAQLLAAAGGGLAAPAAAGLQALHLEGFDCVFFIEAVLAVADCTWLGQQQAGCFIQQLTQARFAAAAKGYRRLHYFEDWAAHQVARQRLQLRTPALGGEPWPIAFSDFSAWPQHQAALPAASDRQSIGAIEAQLSATPTYVLPTAAVAAAAAGLAVGDLVGVVGVVPGLGVTHAGIVVHGLGRRPQLLHASSFHLRVLTTADPLADYLARRAHARRGLQVLRPLPPPTSTTPP